MDAKYIYQTITRLGLIADELCETRESCMVCESYQKKERGCVMANAQKALEDVMDHMNTHGNVAIHINQDQVDLALILLDRVQSNHCKMCSFCKNCDVHISSKDGRAVCPFEIVRENFVKTYYGA